MDDTNQVAPAVAQVVPPETSQKQNVAGAAVPPVGATSEAPVPSSVMSFAPVTSDNVGTGLQINVAQPRTPGYQVFETRGIPTERLELVERTKVAAGVLWDIFNEATQGHGQESGRLSALAKTKLEESVMWFVKGVSRAQ